MPKRYIPNDKWARKAKEEGFRARSIYKLEELDQKFKLLQPGMIVLDLGAAPGSWLQYVSGKIGPNGLTIGLDLQEIKPIALNVVTIRQDILDLEGVEKAVLKVLSERAGLVGPAREDTLKGGMAHGREPSRFPSMLLSDAAPSTSGIHDVDQWRSIELNRSALAVGKRLLKPGGRCVLKVFEGEDFAQFIKDIRAEWKDVHIIKAKASRDRSTEVYVIARK